MITVEEKIHSYFEKNERQLLHNYPGIRPARLLTEFTTLFHLKPEEVYFSQGEEFFDLLEQGTPLEYISNTAFFYRSHFYVNENVLIPRSETEILVEDSVQYIKKNHHKDFRIAEVGTGSFCIGLSILTDLEKPIDVWAGDISKEAIEVSQINAFRLNSRVNSETKIIFSQSDRLSEAEGEFDFIVSNPPYIREERDRSGVHHQALEFEPHLALFLRDEAFTGWFKAFFEQVANKLKNNGAFFMEGHEDTLEELKELALGFFSEVQLKKDYTGRTRFLHAFK